MKISLHVEQKEKRITPKISTKIIRLKAHVIFPGLSPLLPYFAIVDTGAPNCVIPKYIWEKLNVVILDQVILTGISKSPQCGIKCSLGGVLMKIADETGIKSPLFSTLAYLSHQEDVPLILGYDRCLERFELQMDFQQYNP